MHKRFAKYEKDLYSYSSDEDEIDLVLKQAKVARANSATKV